MPTIPETRIREIRFIPLRYDHSVSQESALELILALFPDWSNEKQHIELVPFTDGITNTLLKAVKRIPGQSEEEIDSDAVLLRAYGNGTEIIIDREREMQNHELLSRYRLAPRLLARFENGMLYRYIKGNATRPEDLRKQPIWKGVARRLAEWHAIIPCIPAVMQNGVYKGQEEASKDSSLQKKIDDVSPHKPTPNIWTVMQRWIFALPVETEEQQAQKDNLQEELIWIVQHMSPRPLLGDNGLVFAHCDLLSGNVIIQPRIFSGEADVETVSFIDYEYATPSPAAFDLANHFAEWGGFECDYTVLPTRAQRRGFIDEYMKSYASHIGENRLECSVEKEADRLFYDVDAFRGIPGFYWGIWALIQATISKIDFDYANYAEIRLNEYWAWKEEWNGSRANAGKEMPLRERRWMQEE